jgi:uncharacterized protein
MRTISIAQARRFALAAQGLDRPRPTGRIDVRHFRRVVDDLGVIQLDSVNAFSRAHYMPFFSRLGSYSRDALDQWLWRSQEMFEYWGHEASLMPVARHRLWRWKMDGNHGWDRVQQIRRDHPGYMDSVLEQVRERGPLRTADLHDPGERDASAMWGWSKGKVALEALFMEGHVTAADRPNFVRMYDLTERVVPHEHHRAEGLDREAAQTELLMLAARSMGVATMADISDYYRIRMPQARPLVRRLSSEGRLVEVDVDGWDGPTYLHPDARLPRRVEGRALLSPFDNLIWFRDRVERMWDFHYRIEIYVPEAKRVYGYYVLPFLLDGDLVARVDLKTDRNAGRLLVKGAWLEPGADEGRAARELGEELAMVAGWLEMEGVEVLYNGDLAKTLAKQL